MGTTRRAALYQWVMSGTAGGLTGEVVGVIVGVEAVLDVVMHLVVGPHPTLVPVRVHPVVHSCVAIVKRECCVHAVPWGNDVGISGGECSEFVESK